LLGPVVLAVLFLQPVLTGAYHLLPRRCEGVWSGFIAESQAQRFIDDRLCDEIRPTLRYLRRNVQPGDVLFVDRSAQQLFVFYREQFGLTDLVWVEGNARLTVPREYYAELEQMRGQPRVWYLLTRASLEESSEAAGEPRAKLWLDGRATLLDRYERDATALYLYQFG
jgi:hypothetical protein